MFIFREKGKILFLNILSSKDFARATKTMKETRIEHAHLTEHDPLATSLRSGEKKRHTRTVHLFFFSLQSSKVYYSFIAKKKKKKGREKKKKSSRPFFDSVVLQ